MKALIYSSVCTILFCLCLQRSSFAQVSSVSIGTETVKDKAVLWLKGNGSQGLLLPVVNRSSFTGLNNSDEKGMLIFDPTDNKVYFWNGTSWVECGGGTSSSNQTLTLNGNVFTLTGSPNSTVPLANNTPTTGMVLLWNGSAWTAANLAGDVTGAANATQVSGIKGKTVPALPASTQALVYTGTAWEFQTISGTTYTAGSGITITGTTITNTGDTDPSNDLTNASTAAGDVTGTFSNLQIASGVVTTTEIANATIATADLATGAVTSTIIADGTIAAADLNTMSASNGQVLKFNGTNWAPAADAGGTTYTAGSGIDVTGSVITNAGDTNAGDDLTTASTAGGDLSGAFSNLQIASGVVTTTEIANATIATGDLATGAVTTTIIADGTIADVDINNVAPNKLTQAAATAGQVLKWNGSAWAPAADDVGGGATPTLANGQILTGNGTTNAASTLGGDATLSGGTLTIAANAIGSSEITDGTIAAADLNTMSASNGQVLKFNGTNWAPAADAGGTTYTAGTGIDVTGSVITNTGDTNAGDDLTTASTAGGDLSGAFSNLQIAASAVTSTEIANATIVAADLATGAVTSTGILDGTIAAADLNTMSASNGQVLKFNGTNWAPAADAGTTYTAGTGINITGTTVTNTGDTDGSDDLTTASTAGGDLSGAFSNLQIAASAVTSTEIANATIVAADLATGAITSTGILDGTIAAADLATGAVTSTTILDGTIAAADLNAMSASNGQVLKFNGTNWAPAADNGISSTLTSTNILVGNGSNVATAVAVSGDATLSNTGVLTLSNGSVSGGVGGKITDASITSADLANGSVSGGTGGLITDATIIGADLASNISISTTGNIATTGTGTLTVAGATTLSTLGGSGAQMVVVDNAGLLSKQALPTAGWSLTGNTGINPATNFIGTTDAQPLRISTNNAERVRISDIGNVGIGTTTPNAPLHVANGLGRRLVLWEQANNDHQYMGFGIDGLGTFESQIPVNSNDFLWKVGTSSTTSNEVMRLTGVGNLGIGTSTPAAKLDVAGTIKITDGTQALGKVLVSDANGLASWGTFSGSALALNNVIPKGNGTGQVASSLTDNGTTVSTSLDFNIATGKAYKINNVNMLRFNAVGTLFVGENAGAVNDAAAFNNTFIGAESGIVNTTGAENTFVGRRSGYSNTTGAYNVFIGRHAGYANTSGTLNTIIGFNAGVSVTTPNANTFLGRNSGTATTTGGSNTFLGERSGETNTIGIQNTLVGRLAGDNNTTGNGLVIVGHNADVGANNLSNAIAIGLDAVVNSSNNAVIGNSSIIGWGFGTQPVAGQAIVVGSSSSNGNGANLTTGGVWTNASDKNKKENFQIVDNEEILAKVKALSITRWNYKGEAKNNTHIGPMAQDFYKLFQTGTDDKTISTIDPSGVALASIQALLKRIEELEAENEKLKSENGSLESKVSSVEQQQQALQKDVEELKRILGLLANNK